MIDADGERHTARVESKLIEDALKQCTYTLQITECNPKDVGNYTLQVKNEYGEAATNVRSKSNLKVMIIANSELND